MKTLQEQYNAIKAGRGSEETFLKEAKSLFPQFLTNPMGFKEVTQILKSKSVIFEGFKEDNSPKAFEKSFKKFLTESEVGDLQGKMYDTKDKKNPDNFSGQQVLLGRQYETQKQPDKTEEQIMDIVLKNLTKDPQYYVKNHAFGLDNAGYTEPETMKASGNFANSGYGTKLTKLVKESLMEGIKKPKKATLDSELSEIDRQSGIVALEAKLMKIDSIVEEKEERLRMIEEDQNLSDLVDKSKVKQLQREIKDLGKKRLKMEKMYQKITGKPFTKELMDEDQDEQQIGI